MQIAHTYTHSINSINQITYLFCPEYNKHWTGHQGRMQPPLTGVHKSNVSQRNKRPYLTEKIYF